jgi:tripartite-type tricarboxylate transporter receptor subunit TctC
MRRRTVLQIGSALAADPLLRVGRSRAADSYPSRTIQIIVPFSAGGSIDVTFRLVAPLLANRLGQSVVIVNRAGGGATIGMNEVAKAEPDGYTLGAASLSFAANTALLKAVPYDPLKDFEPITMVSRSPSLLLVNGAAPAKTLAEFIEWVKSKPANSLNYSSVGIGSSGHLFGALFLSRAGLQMQHVPFTENAFAPVAQNFVQMLFGPIPSSMPWLHDGKLRALAVTSLDVDPSVADIPPLSRTLPGFEAFEWPGLVAPKGTPPAIIERIQHDIAATLTDADLRHRLAALGAEPVGSTPEEFRAFIAKQVETWAQVVRDIGLKAD